MFSDLKPPWKPPAVIMVLIAKTADYVQLWMLGGGTDHHADAALLSSRTHFQSLIHHQVHEGIKSTQNSLNMPASVQLHCSRATLSLTARRNDILLHLQMLRFPDCYNTKQIWNTHKTSAHHSDHEKKKNSEAEVNSHESFLSMNLGEKKHI